MIGKCVHVMSVVPNFKKKSDDKSGSTCRFRLVVRVLFIGLVAFVCFGLSLSANPLCEDSDSFLRLLDRVDSGLRNHTLNWQWHFEQGFFSNKQVHLPFAGTPSGILIPEYLVSIGRDIFGSQELLEAALNNTAMEHAWFANQSLTLTSAEQDDTLGRLKGEMIRDRYHVLEVSRQVGVIVDVGSNVGDFSISAALAHPHMQIIAIEPSPHTYFYLLLNLHLNRVPLLVESDLGRPSKAGVFAINAALTRDGRDVQIRWSDKVSQNAAVDAQEDLIRGWSQASVPSLQPVQFFSSHGIESIELFKIDCEGCEFEVIPVMRKWFRDRNKVKHIAGEIHQSVKNPRTATFARKATGCEIQLTDEVLRQRGCDATQWDVYC